MGDQCETAPPSVALLAFMASGNGEGLTATWLPGTDPCADGWAGVCCGPGGWDYSSDSQNPACPAGGTGTEVTGLNLNGNGDQVSTHPLWPVSLACALWLVCL